MHCGDCGWAIPMGFYGSEYTSTYDQSTLWQTAFEVSQHTGSQWRSRLHAGSASATHDVSCRTAGTVAKCVAAEKLDRRGAAASAGRSVHEGRDEHLSPEVNKAYTDFLRNANESWGYQVEPTSATPIVDDFIARLETKHHDVDVLWDRNLCRHL